MPTIAPGLLLLLGGPPLLSADADPGPAEARDDDIYADIRARLEALGVFSAVDVFEPGGPEASADADYLATVLPGDTEDTDDVDAVAIVRRGRYTVKIEVRDYEPGPRFRTLNRLSNLACNALNGVSLAGETLPPWTMIRRANATTPAGVTGAAILTGEWAQIVMGYDGFNTDE